MLIAVLCAGEQIPARAGEADALLLVETENAAVAAAYPRGDGGVLRLAEIAAGSGAEAVCCGMIEDEALFEILASAGVTRCFAPGMTAVEAARACEIGTLPLIVRPGVLHG